VSLSMVAEYQLAADSISDAILNSNIKGKALIGDKLLKHIVISTDKTTVVRCSSN